MSAFTCPYCYNLARASGYDGCVCDQLPEAMRDKLQRQQEYECRVNKLKADLDRQYNVITSLDPLIGWEILGLRRYKPGVVTFVARRGVDLQHGFAKDEVFAQLQLPP